MAGLCEVAVATDGPPVTSDCPVLLCLQPGRPLRPKCIVHPSLYYPVAAGPSHQRDRLFRLDGFVMLETHLSSWESE